MVVTTTEERLTPQAVSKVREGDPNRLRKRLKGDLDCILLTALHKEPVRRYSSVEAFGEDLGRHLEGPVNAREDSLWYRASRFVRRHPGGVAAGTLIVLTAAAGVLTTLWESRIVIEATGRAVSGRAILAPQMALFLYIVLAGFGVVVYLTRAMFRRAIGCLAAGAVFGLVWLNKFRIDYTMGWWRSAFPATPEPLKLFSMPLMSVITALFCGALFLAYWRVARRFGRAGQVAMLLGVPIGGAIRDRIWWQHLIRVMVARPRIGPLLADAAVLAVGMALGLAVMRLIAGPAGRDPLARTR